jgi:predicted nucleic acid-binding protein
MILPDANLLVAFTWENHEHQAAAVSFFQQHPKVATCPLTELALVRVWMQKGASGADADSALADFVSKYRSRLIPDDLSATVIAGLNQGHRQTTDSYLAMLAKHHGIKLATLEEPLAKRFPEASEWVK